jgi:hypothetical protein
MRKRSVWVTTWIAVLTLGGCANKRFVEDVESRRDWTISQATVSTYPTVVVKEATSQHGTTATTRAVSGTSLKSLGEAPSASKAETPAVSPAAARVGTRLIAPRVTAADNMPSLKRVDGLGRSVVFVDGRYSLMTQAPPGQPKALAETKMFREVMKACDEAIRSRSSATASSSAATSAKPDDTLSPSNAYEFARVALGTLDLAAGYGAAAEDEAKLAQLEALVDDPTAEATVPFDLVAQAYLNAYFKGKFVNRRGVKLAKPKIEGGKVDNATIAAVETVLLEAYFDHRFGTDAPVPFKYEKKYVPEYLAFPADPFYVAGFEYKNVPQYLTDENAEPSATKFVGVQELVVPPAWDPEKPDRATAPEGMSQDEYEVVRMLSGLSGEVKKQVSALVFRIFGGVEFSFVFGGHFSIGNNETLATIVTTLIEVAATRSMEFKWTEFFREFRYHHRKDGKKTVPFLTKADYEKNEDPAGLDLPRDWQDGVLLLIRYHGLLAKVVGD